MKYVLKTKGLQVKVRLSPNMIFCMCNIWVILKRTVIYLYSKKPHDQLFHCKTFQIRCH